MNCVLISRTGFVRGGLSLVEVMVSLLILGGSILVSTQLTGTYLQGEQIEERRYVARQLAHSLMDEILAKSFGEDVQGQQTQPASRLDLSTITELIAFQGGATKWTSPLCSIEEGPNYYPVHPHGVLNPDTGEGEEATCNSTSGEIISRALRGYKRELRINTDHLSDGYITITVIVWYYPEGKDGPPQQLYELSADKGMVE